MLLKMRRAVILVKYKIGGTNIPKLKNKGFIYGC